MVVVNETDGWSSAAPASRLSMGVDDMIKLGELSEENILNNLQVRYLSTGDSDPGDFSIYTYTGTILISVNPYRSVDIFGKESVVKYQSKRIGELPPHIFALADSAYRDVCSTGISQCCIISGESGAGKTETARQFLRYIAAVSASHSTNESWIEQQVLQADAILECFGCAVTVSNNNSSRFGKFYNIHIDRLQGVITGATVNTYLLEQSRIVAQLSRERNYHVFYRLLCGESDDTLSNVYCLQRNDASYKCLGHTSNIVATGGGPEMSDLEGWHTLKQALTVLLFSDSDQATLFGILSGILHLGNVAFTGSTKDYLAAAHIVDDSPLEYVEKLTGIDSTKLAQALTTTTTIARGEAIVSPHSVQAAGAIRDALAKGIYQRLFSWIVDKINTVLDREKNDVKSNIAVLDIYGFEVFDRNSFEQLCINFWNEHLQQFFVGHIFKLEQEQYEREGIDWQGIEFQDNQQTLDLLSEGPLNVFDLINDDTKLGDRSDADMLINLQKVHFKHPDFLLPRSMGDLEFGINHFAGKVYYSVDGFLEKNRDTFSSDLIMAIAESNSDFMVSLFRKLITSGPKTRRRSPSVATQFKTSLKLLLERLKECNPYFVRCIKPNERKLPNSLDRACVLRQLKYCGILATCEIRRAGFPFQHSYDEFRDRYWMLIPRKQYTSNREVTEIVCRQFLPPPTAGTTASSGDATPTTVSSWCLGNTRVFLKDAHDVILEAARAKVVGAAAGVLQRHIRGAFARRRLHERRAAMQTILHRVRAFVVRERFRAQLPRLRRANRHNSLHDHQALLAQAQRRREKEALSSATQAPKSATAAASPTQTSGVHTATGHQDTSEDAVRAAAQALQEKMDRVRQLRRDVRDVLAARHDAPTIRPERSPLHAYIQAHFVDSESDIGLPHAIPLLQATAGQGLGDAAREAFSLLPSTSGTTNATHTSGVARGRWGSKRSGNGGSVATVVSPGGTRRRSFSLFRRGKDSQRRASAETPQPAPALTGGGMPVGTAPVTNFSSVQAVLRVVQAHGETSPLHDEVLCQIVHRLHSEADDVAANKLWLFLGLALTCLCPSAELIAGLRTYLAQPRSHRTLTMLFCERVLPAAIGMSMRLHPPSSLEFHAARVGRTCELTVRLPDDTSITLPAVAARARTSDVCAAVCAQVLGDHESIGWALYIATHGGAAPAVTCISSTYTYLLDAVSHVESSLAAASANSSPGGVVRPWTLLLRREFYAPWYEPIHDPMGAQLVYHQVMNALADNADAVLSDARVVDFLAKRYYVEFGPCDDDEVRLLRVIPQWLHADRISRQSLPAWCRSVHRHLASATYAVNLLPSTRVVANVARLARSAVPGFQRSVDASMHLVDPVSTADASGTGRTPARAAVPVVLTADHEGVCICSRTTHVIRIPYHRILAADIVDTVAAPANTDAAFPQHRSLEHPLLHVICLDQVVMLSGPAVGIFAEAVGEVLTGLRTMSRVGVAVAPQPGGDAMLACEVGDYIVFPDVTARHLTDAIALNATTNTTGIVRTSHVFALATLVLPEQTERIVLSADIVATNTALLATQVLAATMEDEQHALYDTTTGGKVATIVSGGSDEYEIEPTAAFAAYAAQYFNTRHKRTPTLFSDATDLGPDTSNTAWPAAGKTSATTPSPVLHRALGSPDLSPDVHSAAVRVSEAVQRYMVHQFRGPARDTLAAHHPRALAAATDALFADVLRHPDLSDEVFCQVLLQLFRTNRVKRACELLWLCAAHVAPSPVWSNALGAVLDELDSHPTLQRELAKRQTLAAMVTATLHETRTRLGLTATLGPRAYPPHGLEVARVQRWEQDLLRHTFEFPSGHRIVHGVDSQATVRQVLAAVGAQCHLLPATIDSLGLCIAFAHTTVVADADNFFWDELHAAETKIEKDSMHSTASWSYKLQIVRRLWINVIPGEDLAADEHLHFDQERQKYLRGLYSISGADTVRMAVLLHVACETSALAALIPATRIYTRSAKEWQQDVTAALRVAVHGHDTLALRNPRAIDAIEARHVFLSELAAAGASSHDPAVFGSALFEVEHGAPENSPLGVPAHALLQVHQDGIAVLDPRNEHAVVVKFAYAEVLKWSTGLGYIHIDVQTPSRNDVLILLQTPESSRIADLMSLYKSMAPRHEGFLTHT
eukprot:m.1347145 g.1347145  ORF g.1347145 m.1347145 type:complete len:2141 (-) comp24909_c0_seq1:347-6769(-)